VSGAAALIFFAYLGFDELGNFAEEMRHPERDLLRALSSPSRSSTPPGWAHQRRRWPASAARRSR